MRYSLGNSFARPNAMRPKSKTRSVTEIGTAPNFSASTTLASSNTARPKHVHNSRLRVNGCNCRPLRLANLFRPFPFSEKAQRALQMLPDVARVQVAQSRPPFAAPDG